MIVPSGDEKWDRVSAWLAYKDDCHDAYAAYTAMLREQAVIRDQAIDLANDDDVDRWSAALDRFRANADALHRQAFDEHSITCREAEAGINNAWDAYLAEREQMKADLVKAVQAIIDFYYTSVLDLADAYQRDLRQARRRFWATRSEFLAAGLDEVHHANPF